MRLTFKANELIIDWSDFLERNPDFAQNG